MEHPATTGASDVLDRTALTELQKIQREGAESLLTRLLNMFLERGPQQLSELEAAMSRSDWVEVHRISHTLKANAATLGAHELTQVCRAIEISAKSGEPDEIRNAFRPLTTALQRVLGAIKELQQS